ncbi:MAG: cytosolic protein [Vulcanimicrobiaceae bacterium]
MKIALLFTAGGPLVIATSYTSFTDSRLLEKLDAKGIDKFVAYELPFDLVKQRYAGHFDIAMQDLHQSDDLRVLDFNGERAFRLFHLKELGTPVMFE